MTNKVKELLLEKFEVISRAADDCTYILSDTSLSKEEIKNKLYTRFDRINDENQVLEGYLGAYFKEPENVMANRSGDGRPLETTKSKTNLGKAFF